jgi:ABC-type transport system substrate-binding protein
MAAARTRPLLLGLKVVALALLGSCQEPATGPIQVAAIGSPPRLDNPNLRPLDPPSAFLAEAVAQGLVRFDAAGEIEPALAQSWIVSDDGLRYTFRVGRAQWTGGSRVTAQQVAARLQASVSPASRNTLKPVLAAMRSAVAMTDQVLEIGLSGPRPNMLQLLAQPEAAILLNGQGTGPYQATAIPDGSVRLLATGTDADDEAAPELPDIVLRGDAAAHAVAAFAHARADLVVGGTGGDLLYARVAGVADAQLVFDPVAGLFGLAFTAPDAERPLADAAVRRALSMAIDRDGLVASLGVPGQQPRLRIVPAAAGELPVPALPDWAAAPLPMRRELAQRVIERLEEPLRLRVAMPDAPGDRIVFAHLRRDWRLIGVEAERVPFDAPADLRLVDAVAPAALASWYLRHFTCDTRRVCDPVADQAMEAARIALTPVERQVQLARAD